MLHSFKKFLLVVVIIATSGVGLAQEVDLIVGDVDFPENRWGKQTLPFQVTNLAEWPRFLIVETEVSFEDSYVNPHRVTRTTFIVAPEASLNIDPGLEIPGNYGRMTLWLRIYDVVDTLDDLSLGSMLFEQPFKIRFPTPDAIVPYFQERLTLPPQVGNHGLLDNEFARLLLVLSREGKTLTEIAEMCQADPTYVTKFADRMVDARYLTGDGDQRQPGLPIVSHAYAQAGRELADRAANKLTERIAANLAGRRPLMDSLIRAGTYSGDSTNFFEGGTLLYQPYPLVTGLYLWQLLGQKFITGTRNLLIFQGTDPCYAAIRDYMYMVQGGDYFNGNHYYNANTSGGGFVAHFGDKIPEVICKPGFEKKFSLKQAVDWNYAPEQAPESFLYDTIFVNPMLRILDAGIEDILQAASEELRQINSDQGFDELAIGTRYWFWNLTASRTVANLVEVGAITPSGNGQYRLMEKKE